jgi:hypothetical protein
MDKSRAAILSAAAGNTHTQTHKRSRLKTHNPGCDVGLFSSPRKERIREIKLKKPDTRHERESERISNIVQKDRYRSELPMSC